jgi:sugar lactone lactonase YvrE
MQAEQLTDAVTTHGEGPVWDEVTGQLRWVDMLAGDVLTMAADGAVTRRNVGQVAAAVRARADGGLVVGTERGFALLDADGQAEAEISAFADPGSRMNDGGVDRQGRFFCGSMDYGEVDPRAALYRLGTGRDVSAVLTGVTVSNGIAWTMAGDRMYYIDSVTRQVDVFDYDVATGTPAGRRPHVVIEVEQEGSVPDGLALDAEDGVWVAIHGERVVRRYNSGGALDAVIEVAADKVTACAFGGPDLSDLYITTSRQNLPAGTQPAAGALFRVRPGVRGIPAGTFAG